MKQNVKVGVILALLSIGVIIIAIFAMRSDSDALVSTREYEENIRALNDTIKELRVTIAKYEAEIERIDFEREQIKREVELIIEDNEKVDSELADGDWDGNIKFLTDFLSEEDIVGR